jgi:hypothetical protein
MSSPARSAPVYVDFELIGFLSVEATLARRSPEAKGWPILEMCCASCRDCLQDALDLLILNTLAGPNDGRGVQQRVLQVSRRCDQSTCEGQSHAHDHADTSSRPSTERACLT